MIAFRDRKRRLWTARLDVAAAVRMRDLAGVDVMALACNDDERRRAFSGGLQAVVDLGFALRMVVPEWDDRMFGRWLKDEGRAGVVEVFLAELVSFFDVPNLSPGQPDEEGEPRTEAAELWGDLWHLASVAGVGYPGPFTFGELVAMADGKRKHEWAQVACLRADLHNTRAFGRGPARQPAEFDPTGGLRGDVEKDRLTVSKGNLGTVASIFMSMGRG